VTKASDNVFSRFLVSEGGSTATPASGRVTMYAKADGLVYSKDDAGTETLVSGGAGAGAMALLASNVLGGAGTFSFTSISGSYNHLEVIVYGRLTPATVDDFTYITVNNDTGSNYNRIFIGAAGTTLAASESNTLAAPGSPSFLGYLPASSATSGWAGMIRIYIPVYAGTTFHKVIQSHYATPVNGTNTHRIGGASVHWNSTSAITRVDILVNGGSTFVTGSAAYLYGIL
jgi:hypothetical protein